jgi:hypothetical protein
LLILVRYTPNSIKIKHKIYTILKVSPSNRPHPRATTGAIKLTDEAKIAFDL